MMEVCFVTVCLISVYLTYDDIVEWSSDDDSDDEGRDEKQKLSRTMRRAKERESKKALRKQQHHQQRGPTNIEDEDDALQRVIQRSLIEK